MAIAATADEHVHHQIQSVWSEVVEWTAIVTVTIAAEEGIHRGHYSVDHRVQDTFLIVTIAGSPAKNELDEVRNAVPV